MAKGEIVTNHTNENAPAWYCTDGTAFIWCEGKLQEIDPITIYITGLGLTVAEIRK